MKLLPVIAILLGRALTVAAEPGDFKGLPPGMCHHAAPRAWLGLTVSKPDASITAHLPSLPAGIGFVVQAIEPDSPAAAAGLQTYDVLWKLGDQWLVNEGQLAALLRLAKPGEEITFSGFRAGQPMEVKAKLGEAPARKRAFPRDWAENAILPPGEAGGPMRVVNVAEKLATYATNEGSLEVRKDGETYQVKIQDPGNRLIYQGELPQNGSLDEVPPEWRRRVIALRRGLNHALEGGGGRLRQPRPRVVPPSEIR